MFLKEFKGIKYIDILSEGVAEGNCVTLAKVFVRMDGREKTWGMLKRETLELQ